MAQLTQTLTPSTRMAIQAAFAVSIAIFFGHFFQFERSYWAILTSMVLISQTWDESIKKSLNRITMTVIGGISGTVLYFCFKEHSHILLGLLLICVFFVVFFLETSYIWVVFFISNMVVFLFALLQNWTLQLLLARIEETIIGAAIAILTCAIILPSRVKSQFQKDLHAFFTLAAEISESCLCALHDKQKSVKTISKKKTQLLKLLNQLDSHNKTSHLIFSLSQEQRQLKSQLLTLNILAHYLISMIETLPYLIKNPSLFIIVDEVQSITEILARHFVLLQSLSLVDQKLDNLAQLKNSILAKIANHNQQDRELKQQWLEFYAFLYFVRRVNELLTDLLTSRITKLD